MTDTMHLVCFSLINWQTSGTGPDEREVMLLVQPMEFGYIEYTFLESLKQLYL